MNGSYRGKRHQWRLLTKRAGELSRMGCVACATIQVTTNGGPRDGLRVLHFLDGEQIATGTMKSANTPSCPPGAAE